MGNWYCTNCSSYQDSWAEHQSHKPTETYRRDIRCWRCDKRELTYTDSQKANYKELVKERISIPGYVEEVERFGTWWNNNLATIVVYHDGYYRVFLLVYDSVYSTWSPAVFPVDKDYNHWGDKSRGKFNYSSDAKNEANWLREKLAHSYGMLGTNPILLIHPSSDCSRSFNSFIIEPYVVKKYSISYLKPLDIVKTYMSNFGFDYYHAGVYLGEIDGEIKVCQFTRDKNDTTIDKWSYFVEGEVVVYHPIIPFKPYGDICGQIVWAKDNHFRKGDYNLANRNCEHFANMIVYGINYSEQMEQNKEKLIPEVISNTSLALVPFTGGFSLLLGTTTAARIINNNRTSFCLQDEIICNNVQLGKKSDYETEKYEIKYLQEIPPKESCWIM